MLRLILPFVILLAASCSPLKSSPWQTDIPDYQTNSTAYNLARLAQEEEVNPPGDQFRIALLGDPQGTPGDFREVIERINSIDDVRFILVLGDLTDYGLKHEYNWAWQAVTRSKKPIFTAVGNHDAISHGKEIYGKMFGAFNYTFTFGGLKFLIWNNNKNEFGTSHFEFLEAEADERTVVASHIPPMLDVHFQPELDVWQEIYEDAGVLASLHGHRGTRDHYDWSTNGIPHHIVAKTSGIHYSIATLSENGLVDLEACVDICESEK